MGSRKKEQKVLFEKIRVFHAARMGFSKAEKAE
jgi:hypothetical protein